MSTIRPHEIGAIELGGVTYQFRTPKMAGIISAMMRAKGKPQFEQEMIMTEAQAKWMRKGVGKEAWAAIEERLDDEDDVLDWPDFNTVFQDQFAKSADRPTTSSPASQQESRTTTPSEEKGKPQESMFGL